MEYYGAAYVFINFEQAMALGHIGWGFKVESDRYFFGSTDHLWNREYPMWHPGELIRYMNVPAGANNDYWSAFGTEEDMLTVMRSGPHVRYHSYKRVPVVVPNPAAAIEFAEALRHNGWNVARNNCVHQSHAVLTRYSGPILPNPQTTLDRIPRRWFAAIQAEEMVLHERVRNSFPILMRAQTRRKIS